MCRQHILYVVRVNSGQHIGWQLANVLATVYPQNTQNALVASWWLLWALFNYCNAKPIFSKLNLNVFYGKLSLRYGNNLLLSTILFVVLLAPSFQYDKCY